MCHSLMLRTLHFHRWVWYRTLSLRYACIRSSGIILIHQATFVPNFVSFAVPVAELASGEKWHSHSPTQSPSLFDSPGTETFTSEQATWLVVTEDWSESFGLVTERRYYNAHHIFHRRVWYRALSLCYACVQSSESSSSPRLPLCQISFCSRPPLLS